MWVSSLAMETLLWVSDGNEVAKNYSIPLKTEYQNKYAKLCGCFHTRTH